MQVIKMGVGLTLLVTLLILSATVLGQNDLIDIKQSQQRKQSERNLNESFKSLYLSELDSIHACSKQAKGEFKVCSSSLRNEGNAPFILHAKEPIAYIALFHGLSDSPFFMRSIAEFLQHRGYTVLVALTPGHGKRQADEDMQDPLLKQRWLSHVDAVMALIEQADKPTFIGGFSAGGTFASHYALNNHEKVDGVLLFSAALSLDDNAESISKIWGTRWVAKIVDGDYVTSGPNPHKYPKIPLYGALELMDIINELRDILRSYDEASNMPSIPIFSAHSVFDKTTPLAGVESLLAKVEGDHSLFKIDESYRLCHADLPMSSVQIIAMDFNKSLVNEYEDCAVPKANPLHTQMLNMLAHFLAQQK